MKRVLLIAAMAGASLIPGHVSAWGTGDVCWQGTTYHLWGNGTAEDERKFYEFLNTHPGSTEGTCSSTTTAPASTTPRTPPSTTAAPTTTGTAATTSTVAPTAPSTTASTATSAPATSTAGTASTTTTSGSSTSSTPSTAATPPPAPDGGLPETGSTLTLALAAAMLVALGLVVVRTARRPS